MRHHACVGCLSTGLLALTALLLASPLPADEPFDYFSNSWNVIGLKDYEEGSRVTPQNEILLAEKGKLRFRFGRRLVPLSRRQIKTVLDGWIPVILLSAKDKEVRYDFKFWSTPLPTARDWREAFDWPTEGENFLNWIVVRATNTGAAPAEAKLKVEQTRPAGPKAADSSAAEATSPAKRSGRAQQPGVETFSWKLAPGATAEAVLRVPFAPVAEAAAFANEDPKLWLERTVAYWRDLMGGAARIEVPCRKATEALLAAHVCQLIANDHGELQGGEGFYDHFYIRDGAYQLMELEEAGLWDAAEKAVARYLECQGSDGRFETQKGQLDANGQAPWVLWQYYKITADGQWLARAYPQMRRAVDWASKARRRAAADSPFVGVLPAAVADGEYLWDGKHHILGYDFWNLRAILCTADAASALGKSNEAEELLAEAKLYRAAIDAAWKRTGLAHFPPSWEKKGTHWGNTETLWPTAIFPKDDPRVAALIDEVRNNHGGGFAEGTILWLGTPDAIHPYMGAYTTMACLALDRHETVVEDFYWYLLHSSASHAFPEGIYFKRRFAWSNTIPHVTGASNYALLLRHMLLDERGGELHLLPAVPDWWLGEGRVISIRRAPTHFGIVNLTVRGTASGVEVSLDPPKRTPPGRIVLHLPKSRQPTSALPGVEVALRSEQKQRWDFPTVVKLYHQQMPEAARPIAGLILPPLEVEPVADRCRMLDLGALANTDPFTAPFGVKNVGKLVFAGMRVGVQTVDGVPFEIIDPARNNGRGLIVLHSPRAPKEREFPKEVEIPVGGPGKRLFFLGGVHGWSSGDRGAGDWSALGEYVICYADGQKQIVPLIAGRTSEEWMASPGIDGVLGSLEGDPWHLNVLGVKLREVAVEKIIFRDLGTVAAPVLAAVTLEK